MLHGQQMDLAYHKNTACGNSHQFVGYDNHWDAGVRLVVPNDFSPQLLELVPTWSWVDGKQDQKRIPRCKWGISEGAEFLLSCCVDYLHIVKSSIEINLEEMPILHRKLLTAHIFLILECIPNKFPHYLFLYNKPNLSPSTYSNALVSASTCSNTLISPSIPTVRHL